jgi:hypothetical protein
MIQTSTSSSSASTALPFLGFAPSGNVFATRSPAIAHDQGRGDSLRTAIRDLHASILNCCDHGESEPDPQLNAQWSAHFNEIYAHWWRLNDELDDLEAHSEGGRA